VAESEIQGPALFRGLLLAQGLAMGVMASLAFLLAGKGVALAAFWGGSICFLAHAWAGYQLWLHPGNRLPARRMTAGFRAQVGKIIITVMLLWLTFREIPAMQTRDMAAALIVSFFITQVAGLVWLVRNSSRYIQPLSSGDNDTK
jgi:ATP synthase protein I